MQELRYEENNNGKLRFLLLFPLNITIHPAKLSHNRGHLRGFFGIDTEDTPGCPLDGDIYLDSLKMTAYCDFRRTRLQECPLFDQAGDLFLHIKQMQQTQHNRSIKPYIEAACCLRMSLKLCLYILKTPLTSISNTTTH